VILLKSIVPSCKVVDIKYRMLCKNIQVIVLKRIGHFECSDLHEGAILFNNITCIYLKSIAAVRDGF